MNPLAQVLVEEILGENTSPKKKIVGMFEYLLQGD